MTPQLQTILNLIHQSPLSDEDKSAIEKSLKEVDKTLEIVSFKLDRTEKVKRTTAILLEETIAELEQKRKAVEDQNHELSVEASLERVRAVAMSMMKPDDLLNICEVIFKEFHLLGFMELRNALINILNDEKNTFINYDYSDKIGKSSTTVSYNAHPFIEKQLKQIKTANDAFSQTILTGDELKEWIEARRRNGEKDDPRLENTESLYYYFYSIGKGAIGISTLVSIDEEKLGLLKRFRNVFSLSYQRYMDIAQAEAQAREAQIEAGLERVRGRAMAMQTSEELSVLIGIVFSELTKLDVNFTRCAILIYESDKKALRQWMANAETPSMPMSFFVAHKSLPYLNSLIKAWDERALKWQYILEGNDKFITDEFLLKETELVHLPDFVIAGMRAPQKVYISASFNNFGCVTLASLEPLSDEHFDILFRFAKVFDLTYTRFNDLQVAEAQAREAKIETSLEKVRTVALTMKKSDEMLDIARALYEQLLELGFTNIRNAIIDLHNDKTETFLDYDYSHEMGGTVTLMSYYEDPIIEKQVRQIVSASDAFFELILEGRELQDLIDIRLKNGEEEDTRLRKIKMLSYNLYSFGNGAIGISNFGLLSDEQKSVLKRFRNVFAFAYKRYTDMVQAEAQAREAQVEAALERVRSRTLAMQKSDELAETSAVLFQQLILLGIEPNRLYICIVENENGDSEFWITDEDGSKVSIAYRANLLNNPTFKKMFDGWLKQDKSQVIDMKGEELQLYFKYLNNIHVPFKGGLEQKRRLQYIAYFNNGFIGMASPDKQPEDTLLLLERFAGVFNLTFTRFNDLKVAEAHALQAEQDLIEIKAARKKAEDTLTELQATQKQLIQSEKMASLGELTAGIAHEIQNPLNFVNNFSEVNKELVDELKAELAIGNLQLANDIAGDIKENSEKINHHGKRAGDIVKGMLQHSRTSTGQKEITDINALADEYLRLAYHGLRAKDKSFNAATKTDYDDSIGLIKIIPQDMGRVILNLITNAFYAVNERKKLTPEGFEPVVSVSTKKNGNTIEIKVKDNGNGIPSNIINKIFQPFFTTKPTGSGTGLGLSLSYDIVKAHGGEIKVETTEGKGTEFIIQLPAV